MSENHKLQIGDYIFEIPNETIKNAKPFEIECVADITLIKGGQGFVDNK